MRLLSGPRMGKTEDEDVLRVVNEIRFDELIEDTFSEYLFVPQPLDFFEDGMIEWWEDFVADNYM